MEAMALESLVASAWRLDGFLTVVRHPVRVERAYSDVDVVGVRADGTVRIAECKAYGPARVVYVDRHGRGWSSWALKEVALSNLARLWGKEKPEWLPALRDVKAVKFHLVGNVWFPNKDARRNAEKHLTATVRRQLPKCLRRKAQGFVTSSLDVLLETVASLRGNIVEEGWGKRFGDPLLDALRELVRYAHAQPQEGGRVGRAIPEDTRLRLLTALFAPQ